MAGDFALSHSNADNFDQYTKQHPGPGVQYFYLAEIKSNAALLKSRGAEVISFDLESEYSPESDGQNPVASIKAAREEVVQQNGMICMASPSRALITRYDERLALYLDMYNIQAQELQDNGFPTGYQTYVGDMVMKLRAAIPNLLLITS